MEARFVDCFDARTKKVFPYAEDDTAVKNPEDNTLDFGLTRKTWF